MANSDGFSLFGFQIKKKVEQNWSVVPPVSDDGSTVGNTNSSYYGLALDLEGSVKNENDLIRRYREVSSYSDCDSAIEDIVSEAIVADSNKGVISIELEDLQAYDKLKDIIRNEFDAILKLFDFEEKCHDIFRQWYIDGRVFYNIILDPNPKNGILELRYIDPRKIRKIKLVNKQRDPKTGFDIISNVDEYYLFNDKGIAENSVSGIKMSIDSVIYGHSGVIDYNTGMVLSYLQKAVKPTNQLKVMEDAVVIYRISRAAERRVFYIDVGNLPKLKAEQYVQEQMNRYRNKVVYDANTGTVKDNRQHLSMIEDFWLARRCLALDTKIKLLDGRDVELKTLIEEFEAGKENWTFSVSPEGNIVPGLISWAGVTRENAEVLDVLLDNGETITVTPDHKFILRNGEKIEAQYLQPGHSLMPCNTQRKVMYGNSDYDYIQNNHNNKWTTVHKMVSSFIDRMPENNEVIHHNDFNRYNNYPDNLTIMGKKEHFDYHATLGSKPRNEEYRKNLSTGVINYFTTEAGIIRKKEISEYNRICPEILAGAKKGRETSELIRKLDKETLSTEEYKAKWCKPNTNPDTKYNGAIAAKKQRELDKELLSEEDYKNKWRTKKINDALRYNGTKASQKQRELDKELLSEEDYKNKWCMTNQKQRMLDKELLSEDEYKNKWINNKINAEVRYNGTLYSKKQRELDKALLSEHDFNVKWHKNTDILKERFLQKLNDFDINAVVSVIKDDFYPDITNKEVVDCVKILYPELTITSLRKRLKFYGYDNVSEFLYRNFGSVGLLRSRTNLNISNHKVVSVTPHKERITTGTLTIDGDHLYHNYHNFALSSGVFVMNSGTGGGGTEITTLQSGQNLSEISDINYFQNKLYQALNVPISRLQPQQGFSLGHSTEITREEIKFNKFIERLRRKFASIFRDALRIQLITKGIINPDEWDDIAPLIKFDYQTDNHFAELKNSEIMAQRMNMLQQVDPYIGKYFSIQWVRKNVLMQTDEDLEMMNAEMEQEQEIYAQQQQDELDQQQQSPTNGETKQ